MIGAFLLTKIVFSEKKNIIVKSVNSWLRTKFKLMKITMYK